LNVVSTQSEGLTLQTNVKNDMKNLIQRWPLEQASK
jgi:hypothetical protein